ncbi:hypothetical protein J6590_042647, partial [Homalodisca vitripennis]
MGVFLNIEGANKNTGIQAIVKYVTGYDPYSHTWWLRHSFRSKHQYKDYEGMSPGWRPFSSSVELSCGRTAHVFEQKWCTTKWYVDDVVIFVRR